MDTKEIVNMRHKTARWVALHIAMALVAVGCGSAGTAAESEVAIEGLETVVLNLDEDAPQDIAAAFEESDYVIIASIQRVDDGARFYGESEEDNVVIVYEDITLHVAVEEALKGDPGESMAIRWPGFVGTGRSSAERTGVLQVEGVTLNANKSKGRYLMFLKDYEEPFGLSFVALSSAVVELNPNDIIVGQASSNFAPNVGRGLDEVLDKAGVSRPG